jgi:N-acetylmuramic acid 6-phosphate etherase
VPVVGPEPLTGSTRMKSGTAQKMVLNMISTVAMIRLGYVKGNRMTNVKPANEKLRDRSLRILMAETDLDNDAAAELLNAAAGDLRIALLMHRARTDADSARAALEQNEFVIEAAAADLAKETSRAGK